MRVAWAGTFDPDFPRNEKLARLMEMSGVEVRVISKSLWAGDRIALAARPGPRVVLKALVAYPVLLFRLIVAPSPDVYLVSYPGWFDIPLVRMVASIKRRPVVFDPFISLFDTMISDRGLHRANSLTARLAAAIDRWSLRLSDMVIADTEPQLGFYRRLAGRMRNAGAVIEIGADDELFSPQPEVHPQPNRVLYYGKLIPLHGVATIVEAAALFEDGAVDLVMIGDGPDRPLLESTIARTGVEVERHGMVPLDTLPAEVARACVCLGVFGDSEKAGRVIPHKVYEALAMGKPVVTRGGPAVEATFRGDEVVTVPPADPHALAEAIRGLLDDPAHRESVAAAGAASYRARFHETVLAGRLIAVLDATVNGHRSLRARSG